MFKVGQKVVCIDDTPPSVENGADYCLIRPVAGEIYTIRGIHTEPHIEGYGVWLEECLNPSVIWDSGEEIEWPFASTRFKPLQERAPVHIGANSSAAEEYWERMDRRFGKRI